MNILEQLREDKKQLDVQVQKMVDLQNSLALSIRFYEKKQEYEEKQAVVISVVKTEVKTKKDQDENLQKINDYQKNLKDCNGPFNYFLNY